MESDTQEPHGGTESWQSRMTSQPMRMSHLLKTGDLSDVTLVVGEVPDQAHFKGHKLILSMCSDVLCTMFNHTDSEGVEVEFKDTSPHAFKIAMEYMYKEEFIVSSIVEAIQTYLFSLNYNIVHLRSLCVDYMAKHLDTQNIYLIYNNSTLLNEPVLKSRCEHLISKHASEIIRNRDFRNTSIELMKQILHINKSMAMCISHITSGTQPELTESSMPPIQATIEEQLISQDPPSNSPSMTSTAKTEISARDSEGIVIPPLTNEQPSTEENQFPRCSSYREQPRNLTTKREPQEKDMGLLPGFTSETEDSDRNNVSPGTPDNELSKQNLLQVVTKLTRKEGSTEEGKRTESLNPPDGPHPTVNQLKFRRPRSGIRNTAELVSIAMTLMTRRRTVPKLHPRMRQTAKGNLKTLAVYRNCGCRNEYQAVNRLDSLECVMTVVKGSFLFVGAGFYLTFTDTVKVEITVTHNEEIIASGKETSYNADILRVLLQEPVILKKDEDSIYIVTVYVQSKDVCYFRGCSSDRSCSLTSPTHDFAVGCFWNAFPESVARQSTFHFSEILYYSTSDMT